MKTKLLFVFLLTVTLGVAQNPIPNPGFENWSNGNPSSWSTNNVPGILTCVVQSNNSNSGSSAARLNVVSAFSTTLPPTLFLTNPAPVTQDYQTVSFYYKGNMVNNDALVSVVSVENNGTSIGSGVVNLSSMNANVYTQTLMAIFYSGTGATDLDLTFVIGNSTSTNVSVGSYAIIDDINVSASVGVMENQNSPSLSLGEVFPNPIQGISLLPFSLSSGGVVSIELFSLDGKKIQDVLQTELKAGRYKAELDATQLPFGVYLCKMQAEGRVLFSKVVVQ